MLSGWDARVVLVDCYGVEHVVVVPAYESFHALHRRLLKLLPTAMHGWLHIGLLSTSGDKVEDDKENVTHPTIIQPLPTHCLHASIHQLLQHGHERPLAPSSPPLSLRLGCFADVEVWAVNTLTSPHSYFRLQNNRVVDDRTVREQFSCPITQQLQSRFSLTGQPGWCWYRATRVIGISGHPLDMEKAVELTDGMRVLSCQLDQPDAVLVASITSLPSSSGDNSTLSAVSSEVQLLVQRLAGDHITLSFDANETVASLKRCLHTAFHVPLDEQELFFQQQPLDDNSLIGSYLPQPSAAVDNNSSGNHIALLLSSPTPLHTSSTFYNPITYYTQQAIQLTRHLFTMSIPTRREVRGWGVAECVEWLVECRGRVGAVWAAVDCREMAGVSSTGLVWLVDEEEDALWQQTRDSHLRQLDSIDVSGGLGQSTVHMQKVPSNSQCVSTSAAVLSEACEAEEDGVARVEHIDLDDDDSTMYDKAHTRLPAIKRCRSAPTVSPSKLTKRQRRRRRTVVDLRETLIDSADEEENTVVGMQREEEDDVVEMEAVIRSAPCISPVASMGGRLTATHRQLSFTVID